MEIMEILGLQLQKLLVRFKRQRIQFEVEQQRNNILVFCRGCKTKIKIKIQENSRCNCLFTSPQRPRDHDRERKNNNKYQRNRKSAI